jgi:hypothetical protein
MEFAELSAATQRLAFTAQARPFSRMQRPPGLSRMTLWNCTNEKDDPSDNRRTHETPHTKFHEDEAKIPNIGNFFEPTTPIIEAIGLTRD